MSDTIFLDIDGTLIEHRGKLLYDQVGVGGSDIKPLPGLKKCLQRWQDNNDMVIITTGRPESMREATERQLERLGVPYHTLIMGLPRGARIVINDKKADGRTTAYALSPPRNQGLDCAYDAIDRARSLHTKR